MKKWKLCFIFFISLLTLLSFLPHTIASPDESTPWKNLKKPIVHDVHLQILVDNLFRPMPTEDMIGNGGTSDAVRYEILTGLSVKGKYHSQKAHDYIIALKRWTMNHPGALAEDIQSAQHVLLDLQNALETDPLDESVLDGLFPEENNDKEVARFFMKHNRSQHAA